MNDIHSLAHSKWNCKYHIVFAPKYRRVAMLGEKGREIGAIWQKTNQANNCGQIIQKVRLSKCKWQTSTPLLKGSWQHRVSPVKEKPHVLRGDIYYVFSVLICEKSTRPTKIKTAFVIYQKFSFRSIKSLKNHCAKVKFYIKGIQQVKFT